MDLKMRKTTPKEPKSNQINSQNLLFNNMNLRLDQFSSNHGESREEEKMNNHRSQIK